MIAKGKQSVDDGTEQAKLSQEKKANSRTGLVEGQRAGVELEYSMAWEIPRRVRRASHELNLVDGLQLTQPEKAQRQKKWHPEPMSGQYKHPRS
jgi:hypothetical protein